MYIINELTTLYCRLHFVISIPNVDSIIGRGSKRDISISGSRHVSQLVCAKYNVAIPDMQCC